MFSFHFTLHNPSPLCPVVTAVLGWQVADCPLQTSKSHRGHNKAATDLIHFLA